MIEIQIDSDRIEEEICDAEWYAKRALEFKEKKPSKADTYFQIANEEVGHVNKLHNLVVAEIEAYRKDTGKEPPELMVKMYEIFHKKHINSLAVVKGLLSLYKGG